MKSISIRGVDDELSALIKKEAAKTHKSVNQFILELLKQKLGMDKEKRFTKEHHDLDHLFGSWSEEEFNQIQETIDKERQIDKELWK